ncbi:hypothetical protein LOTGIDRAFT_234919 [Lottia gigantea]|uniref:Uncharacterized protein n=1 Tax=Lottia gigantea TaxID=225164 RepID=V3Z9Q2_LOTGI|nr:hypothetical protein LOTGIDRAFT_234919 [Lottia gigantea]ESO87668.1 hypothetical protein LOTGIDRAFT_234919 [Lottia gigantea]
MYRVKMDFCSVILHLTFVTLIASQATSPNYCSIMCQGKNSSTVCQNYVADFEPKELLAKMNFICCFTNEFIRTHHNYFKDVTLPFKLAIMKENNQDMLYEYAECVRSKSHYHIHDDKLFLYIKMSDDEVVSTAMSELGPLHGL